MQLLTYESKTKRNRFGYISSDGEYERVIEKICEDLELELNSFAQHAF